MRPGRIHIHSFTRGKDVETAYVDYLGDPHLYDSGMKVTVVYRRSEDWCNKRDKMSALRAILRERLPKIPKFYPTVTRLTLEGVRGRPTQRVTEDKQEIVDYIPVPSSLSHIRTVQITDLYKVTALCMDVDQVRWENRPWAFKLTSYNPKGNLREISILDQLSHSPFVIQLEGIVIDRHNFIRGFITPFMPRGDLANVLEMRHTDQGVTNDDGTTIALGWSIKLSWANQITRSTHAIPACHGDIKPRNVLTNETGQALLIDFCPGGITNAFAAPEILAIINDPETDIKNEITAMADMYSLGLVLYVLAEETTEAALPLVWRNGGTPMWYREAVQQCLAEDCDARPTAVELLHTLDVSTL
ncbi:kinase-like protein [Rickenella mellea]|uniref:Kinase-like protein n=1 Tax=Rickenella mellea TaxID=50990 RepID=A0A4Y7QL85_9AGAM|nr:kinase-like protein [Rickenella mellea]